MGQTYHTPTNLQRNLGTPAIVRQHFFHGGHEPPMIKKNGNAPLVVKHAEAWQWKTPCKWRVLLESPP